MKKRLYTGLVLIALLFLVWPVAHTTSLREILLWSSLILFFWLVWSSRPHVLPRLLQWPLWAFAALSLWLLAVALLISPEPAWSLDEIRGQWLKGLVALVVGVCAGLVAARDEFARSRALTILVVPLTMYVVFTGFLMLADLVQDGMIPRRFPVLGSGPDKANYVTNLFLAFVLAEIFLRSVHARDALRINKAVLGGMLFLGLLAEYGNGMRNGFAELGLLAALLVALFLKDRAGRLSPRVLAGAVAALLLALGAAGFISYKSDERWQTFSETLTIAWDIDAHDHWLDPATQGFPNLGDGRKVEESAYLRVTALRAGIRLIAEHPLGVGYGRNAYGHALQARYGGKGLGHSHSGIVDMAIGVGLPGVAAWILFLGSLFVIGWSRFRETREYAPLLLLLVVTGYSARMLVDSVIRDHMLQQFLLLAGLLAVLSVVRQPETSS